jgi:hypothetical protein
MKAMIMMMLAVLFAVSGCGTMMANHYAKMSTAQLQLERQQIIFRAMTGDTDDIDRKEAIERELMQRGAMPQYQPIPRVQYGGPMEQY